ncbi:MAG TPA: BMP family ABC transporter substrate-binding protein [Gaiellaceae bacterium]|nr:BMP family ABC transporter substrate-binding protein [Gaiellaceae bacterium]
MRRTRIVGGLLVLAAVTAAALAAVFTSGSASAAPTASVKVGLVTDIGGLNDRSFNHLAYLGLTRAEKKLGIQGRVLTSTSGSDYIPNLSTLARQGYQLVIGVGFLMADAIDTVATKFPNTHFAIIDVDQTTLKHKPANVEGLLFHEQESGYLAGYLAALVVKAKGGTQMMGSVGGQKIPPVDRYIAGFQAGAKAADPGIKTLNGYSQDFVAQDKCKELALNQIAAGSQVEFQVAGACGLGALDAAKEKGIWGIGVDADQAYLGKHILTSAIKKVDVAVYDTIQNATKNVYHGGGNSFFTLKNGGAGIGKVSPKVPKSIIAKVNAVAKKIRAGKIVPPAVVKG